MRHLIKICLLSLFLTSCGQSYTKQKELELKERELALREKELMLKNNDTAAVKADTIKSNEIHEVKEVDPNTKVMTMTFEEYSEGDYPHFIFKETLTGKTYDFRHISDNQLGGVNVLLDDDNSGFGLKANPKYLKKSFVVEAVNKTVLDYDLEGKTIKTKDWVIKNIKPNSDLNNGINGDIPIINSINYFRFPSDKSPESIFPEIKLQDIQKSKEFNTYMQNLVFEQPILSNNIIKKMKQEDKENFMCYSYKVKEKTKNNIKIEITKSTSAGHTIYMTYYNFTFDILTGAKKFNKSEGYERWTE
jgi:hypothetical protein